MKTIVIGVIGADVHAVGNKIIEYVLKKEGYNVVNIGVLSSQEDFINAAIETNADMILVSSLYGHGEIDCRGMREKCVEAGIGDIPMFVGGAFRGILPPRRGGVYCATARFSARTFRAHRGRNKQTLYILED